MSAKCNVCSSTVNTGLVGTVMGQDLAICHRCLDMMMRTSTVSCSVCHGHAPGLSSEIAGAADFNICDECSGQLFHAGTPTS